MEIVFMVWLTFFKGQINQVHYVNYYQYMDQQGIQDSVRCQKYIRSGEFVRKMRQRLRPGESIRVGCLPASGLKGLRNVYQISTVWQKYSRDFNDGIYIPAVKLGKEIIPDEKPLAEWFVYKEKIHLPLNMLRNKKFDIRKPEEAVANFFAMWIQGKNVEELFAKNTSQKILQKMKNKREKIKQITALDILAKIPTSKLRNGFHNTFSIKKVESYIGHFDMIVFIETPPLAVDSFLFLVKEKDGYKVKAIAGLINK